MLFGAFVIGLVDNILRPALVGKDTKMPDYVVLISTLGGIGIFGLNGFVVGPAVAAMFIAVWDIFPASQPGDDNTPDGRGHLPISSLIQSSHPEGARQNRNFQRMIPLSGAIRPAGRMVGRAVDAE